MKALLIGLLQFRPTTLSLGGRQRHRFSQHSMEGLVPLSETGGVGWGVSLDHQPGRLCPDWGLLQSSAIPSASWQPLGSLTEGWTSWSFDSPSSCAEDFHLLFVLRPLKACKQQMSDGKVELPFSKLYMVGEVTVPPSGGQPELSCQNIAKWSHLSNKHKWPHSPHGSLIPPHSTLGPLSHHSPF